MIFDVKYRDRNGVVSHKIVEAETRLDCIAKCKKSNIIPVEITVAKNKAATGKDNSALLLSRAKYLVLFTAFVGLTVAVYIHFSGNEDKAETQRVIKKTKPIKPLPNTVSEVKASIPPVISNVTIKPPPQKKNRGTVRKAIPAGVRDKIVNPDGTVKYVRRKTTPFTNRVDSLIWAAVRPAGFPVGLKQWIKHHTEAELIEALNAPMNYDDKDSESVAELKKYVADIKTQMLSSLNKGHSIDEIMSEIELSVNDERKQFARAQKVMKDLASEGDPGMVSEYVQTVNEDLKAKGIRELNLPKKFRPQDKKEEQ